MNEERWNRLSEEDRAAIDAISGEAFARRAGEVWDEADAAAIEIMSAAGHEFVEPGPDLLELVGDKAAVLEEEWVGEAAERGVDGKAVLAALRATTGVTTAQVSR
jgi:TRAP-type C4-dicarboxylate transport system substrate-binding protein